MAKAPSPPTASAAGGPLSALIAARGACLAAVSSDDAAALLALPPGSIALAQAFADASGGKLGLASLALRADAGRALKALAQSPEWIATRCESPSDVHALMGAAIEEAAMARASSCARALASMGEEMAWRAAGACAPQAGLEQAPWTKARSGWGAGYARALGEALSHPEAPSAALFEQAARAIAAGLLPGWGKADNACSTSSEEAEAHRRAQAAALSAARTALDRKGASAWIAQALACGATRPGPAQAEAWELAQKAAKGKRPQSAKWQAQLRIEAETKPLTHSHRNMEILFPAGADWAWAACARASGPESEKIASEICLAWGDDPAARPSTAPRVEGMAHPLCKVWDVWDHSRKAGFALPKAPVERAREHFQSQMGRWAGKMGDRQLAEWGAAGRSTLDALAKGKIPPAPAGLAERPSTGAALGALSQPLSPLAWRVAVDRELTMDGFLAVAASQAHLGFDLELSVEQARLVGGKALEPHWAAAASKAILRASVAPAPKRSGPTRM